jgi:hypothetical protein
VKSLGVTVHRRVSPGAVCSACAPDATRWCRGSVGAPADVGVAGDVVDVPPSPIQLAAPGQQHEGAVTPDGATLVYREINARTGRDIWAVDLTRPADTRLRARRAIAATPYDGRGIALSPDGRWLADTANQSGRDEVYVRPVADAPERWQVSPSGGAQARWDRAGRVLYYPNADTRFSVAVERASVFRLGARRALFTGRCLPDTRASHDVSPEDRHFLLVREFEPDRPDEVTVVLHALDAADRRRGSGAAEVGAPRPHAGRPSYVA